MKLLRRRPLGGGGGGRGFDLGARELAYAEYSDQTGGGLSLSTDGAVHDVTNLGIPFVARNRPFMVLLDLPGILMSSTPNAALCFYISDSAGTVLRALGNKWWTVQNAVHPMTCFARFAASPGAKNWKIQYTTTAAKQFKLLTSQNAALSPFFAQVLEV